MTPGRKLMLLIERMSGIVLPDRELQRLTDWAGSRAALRGFKDTNAYVDALRQDPENDEWRVLLSRVTVKESSLFRAPQQFRCLRESLIPELIATGRKSIQVWSAGCARGEEPATVAVVLAECLAGTDVQWSVLGTDVDADALESARRGRFSQRSVRRVPAEHLERYFEVRSGAYELKAEIRSHIRYASLNVVREPLEVPGQPFDIIFLRNLLIYFGRESQARVVKGIQEILAPDGFLLVGPSESLMNLAPDLRAEERKGVFVYIRREVWEERSVAVTIDGKSPESGESDACPKAPPRPTVSHQPKGPESLAIEGRRAEVRGGLRTALRCYRASLYLQPDLYQVRYRLGHCLEAVGWPGRAGAEFRAVLEILRRGSEKSLEIFDGPGFPGRNEIEAACLARTSHQYSSRGA